MNTANIRKKKGQKNMNNYTANKELKAVLDAFAAEYKAASETSRIAFMQSMNCLLYTSVPLVAETSGIAPGC